MPLNEIIGEHYGFWRVVSDVFIVKNHKYVSAICKCGTKKNVRHDRIIKGEAVRCSRWCTGEPREICSAPEKPLAEFGDFNRINGVKKCFRDKSEKIVSIYGIMSPTWKMYIGQSHNTIKRFCDYNGSRQNYRSQKSLSASLVKYGASSHIFGVIHELPIDVSQSVLDLYEQFYISLYIEAGFEMMNIRSGGSRGKHRKESIEKIRISKIGKRHSQDVLDRLSKMNRERAKTPEGLANCSKGGKANKGLKRTAHIETFRASRPNSIKIDCFKSNGEFVGQYRSQSECSRQLGLQASKIWMVINGLRPHHKGFLFKKA